MAHPTQPLKPDLARLEGQAHPNMTELEVRYDEERQKRLRSDANAQFADILLEERYKGFAEDPWAKSMSVESFVNQFPDSHIEILIIGAGWGGIQYAIRMVEEGYHPESIRIVDTASGFGGVWYWNRYPGLMCDIESYTYLPLLEETGYIPKHRYSESEEIRQYANSLVRKFGLEESGVFQTKVHHLRWDEDAKEWIVDLIQRRKDEEPRDLTVRANFVAICPGFLSRPKLPAIPGILDFEGDMFHSSRWPYDLTGGSPIDPSLDKLKDKQVAIIGTGTSSAQIVPHLARWCKHLYVLQRTPASVDFRGQKPTDETWFHNEVATGKNWQRERQDNFDAHFTLGEQPAVNCVDDEWTHARGMVAITGNPNGPKLAKDIPAYLEALLETDAARQNRIRGRVDNVIKDPSTAQKLKSWYPTWCKRPVFHDDYLQAFNNKNVTLVDTDGKGVEKITTDSLIASGKKHKVDMIVFATGYQAPGAGTVADRADLTIIGRRGVSLREEVSRFGSTTLHGILDTKFPNLFLSGPSQASTNLNGRYALDQYAKHVAYILSEAKKRAKGKPFAVAPSAEASEDWAKQVSKHSTPLTLPLVHGCTPSAWNLEGDFARIPSEYHRVLARSWLWGWGMKDWIKVVEGWRAEGGMKGIDVIV